MEKITKVVTYADVLTELEGYDNVETLEDAVAIIQKELGFIDITLKSDEMTGEIYYLSNVWNTEYYVKHIVGEYREEEQKVYYYEYE